MKRLIIVMLLAVLLTGCSKETHIWLPEEEVVTLQQDVIRIPVGDETEPTETETPSVPAETAEPEQTQPEKEEKVTITKKPTTSPKKSTDKQASTNKETVTATGSSNTVSTEPIVTEPIVTEPPRYEIDDYQVSNLEYEMLDRINEHRADAELEPLWLDTRLCAIASCRSFEASFVWSHTRPDGRNYATVLSDYNYSAGAVQELLVYDSGSGDADAIVDRWMESKQQREQLLSDDTTTGIGVYRIDGLTYVTCLLVK